MHWLEGKMSVQEENIFKTGMYQQGWVSETP
jgi:hypothetical protein